MGFKPTGYEEIFVASDNADKNLHNTEMVCVYPGGDKKSGTGIHEQGHVLSKSEMVVRKPNESFWRED